MSKKIILICIILIIIIGILLGYIILKTSKQDTTVDINNKTNLIVNETEKQNDIIKQENISSKGENEMQKVSIIIENQTFTATLYDNETTRELIKQMPLTINMNELNGNEKYYYLKQGLPANSEKIGNIKKRRFNAVWF
jgi:hypothetical protein